MTVEFKDNSAECKKEFDEALRRALEKCGLVAEGYAKNLCPVDTGNLRNSITHAVVEQEEVVYIGSNVEYAAYVELGTGEYYPGGSPTPWAYQDGDGSRHTTREKIFAKSEISEKSA